jgi:IS5 family transposase
MGSYRHLSREDREEIAVLRAAGHSSAAIAAALGGSPSTISRELRRNALDTGRYDGRELPGLLDRTNTGSKVWADTAYRSAKNERRIAKAGLASKVHFRKPPGKPMPEPKQRANAARSRPRSAIEHVFADQKHRMGLFVRTIGIARARTKIGLANIAYNLRRYVF